MYDSLVCGYPPTPLQGAMYVACNPRLSRFQPKYIHDAAAIFETFCPTS